MARMRWMLLVVVGCAVLSLAGRQLMAAGGGSPTQEVVGYWRSEATPNDPNARRFELDLDAMARLLSTAPLERSYSRAALSPVILEVPTPSGTMARFRVAVSPILEPELAARFPEIRTYVGQGVEDPTQTMRCDVTPQGFHAIVLGGTEGAYTVLPEAPKSQWYRVQVLRAEDLKEFRCNPILPPESEHRESQDISQETVNFGSQLRRYRIAIAATGEFTNAPNLGGGTVAGALAAIVTYLNGANAIYERDLAVRFVLVNNNTSVIYTNPATDPYPSPNNTEISTLDAVREDLENKIRVENYDIGHVLGVGGGGIANIGVVCRNNPPDRPLKGGGVTLVSSSRPPANTSDLSIFCHELGHQCAATHTFNGTLGFCTSNQRSPGTAWEVGSGSTIMSYGGSCGSDNVAPYPGHQPLNFHAGSITQMDSYLSGTTGGICVNPVATGNTPPTVNTVPALTIPRNTPFQLTAAGSDPDGDSLTYTWEQLDAGGNTFVNPPYGDQPNDPSTTTRPLFRSFPPTTSPTRIFPSLQFILNNANVPPDFVGDFRTGENLPRVTRQMRFRVTARDNRAGGGGVRQADTVVSVAGGAGPFTVTNITTPWTPGSTRTVSWSVAGTNQSPVNCTLVNIQLSYDGGTTFTTIAANVPNTGTATVIVPSSAPQTTQARVRVEAANGVGVGSGNTFFDITDTNFSITQGSGCSYTATASPTSFAAGGGTGQFTIVTSAGCPWAITGLPGWISAAPTSGSGGAVVDFTVAANSGAARTATVTVAGQVITITQAAGCSYTATASPTSFAAVGGTGQFTIVTQAGCPWTITGLPGRMTAGAQTSGNWQCGGELHGCRQ
ncbi:MAG: M12 family metallo-peptidase [Acidobacteriota bacterium]|nr:M12 family metallo-peptidase [Acidobacteriota bacterium]